MPWKARKSVVPLQFILTRPKYETIKSQVILRIPEWNCSSYYMLTPFCASLFPLKVEVLRRLSAGFLGGEWERWGSSESLSVPSPNLAAAMAASAIFLRRPFFTFCGKRACVKVRVECRLENVIPQKVYDRQGSKNRKEQQDVWPTSSSRSFAIPLYCGAP